VVRTPPLGGCGNALMLIVFLIVFPAGFNAGVARNLGSAEFPVAVGVVGGGIPEVVEGARSPLLGRLGGGVSELLKSEIAEIPPVLLRVFVVGNAGSAAVGGPYDGLEGRGIVAAMSKGDFQRRVMQGPTMKYFHTPYNFSLPRRKCSAVHET
jgi:hypothetical protein